MEDLVSKQQDEEAFASAASALTAVKNDLVFNLQDPFARFKDHDLHLGV